MGMEKTHLWPWIRNEEESGENEIKNLMNLAPMSPHLIHRPYSTYNIV
jgi:hypothetical protein